MRKHVILLLILLLAVVLRFYKLDTLPPAFYGDEISQAYNAYSILITGKDEHQEFFPIARFKSFGDYKAPVLIYLDVVSMAIFGKTDFAVRFPSALFGTLTVLVSYFLVVQLFTKHEKKKTIALLTAFFLAISPWHIQLSRATFEANIATFFTVTGILLFLSGIHKKRWLLILSAVSFVLAFYSFNAHRVFVPLLVVFLSFVYRKELFVRKSISLVAVLIGTIMMTPFLLYFTTPESRLRFNEVNIFSDLSVIEQSNEYLSQDNSSVAGRVIHNRRVMYGQSYLQHYFDFFNPRYLFFSGDGNPRFSHQENGQMFLWMLPLLLVGSYLLLRQKNKTTLIVFGWFLLAPVAAATARETPHALRTETFIPTFEIVAAVGLVGTLFIVKRFSRLVYQLLFVGFAAVVVFSVVTFVHNYIVHYPYIYSGVWQEGYKEAIQKVETLKQNYDKVVFTDRYGRAYIYLLWYGNIAPQYYWRNSKVIRDVFGFYNVYSVGKYEIQKNPQVTSDTNEKILYVLAPTDLITSLKILDTVSFKNGKTAFVLAERSGNE